MKRPALRVAGTRWGTAETHDGGRVAQPARKPCVLCGRRIEHRRFCVGRVIKVTLIDRLLHTRRPPA